MRVRLPSVSTDSFRIPSSIMLNNLLQLCSNSKAVNPGKQVHNQILIHGFDQNSFMATKLVQMYADCEYFTTARQVFDKIPQPNIFAWTAILAFYSRSGMLENCINTYRKMKLNSISPDRYVLPKVIRACAQSLCLKFGIQFHKEVITYGTELNLQVSNSLIDMYSKCGDSRSSRRVFDYMVERDLLSWNSMISGYVSTGFLESALELFNYMRLQRIEPDTITLNTTMDAYCRMGKCNEASKIFELIKKPNIISWTTLISGYSRVGEHEVTLRIFTNMCNGEVSPDLDCLSTVLVSCRYTSNIKRGKQIHAYAIKTQNGNALYNSAGPALLTMYAKCRKTQSVINVFSLMDQSDVVSWNAMIHGYSDLGLTDSALECLRTMQKKGLQIDQTTISTVLPLCELKSGEQSHAYVIKNGFDSVIQISNTLIHMYSKCGCIQTAYSIFSDMAARDVVSYNVMINGFGKHGLARPAIQLFQDMSLSLNVNPTSATFTSLLSACSHSGLVEEGLEIFNRLTRTGPGPRPGPGPEHFACVVDLLARNGRIDDAVGFIERMPVEADKRIWGAVLSAAREHHNVTAGMLASENLVRLEPENAGHYVTLSNMYAEDRRWDDAARIRAMMENRGLVKASGYSWMDWESDH